MSRSVQIVNLRTTPVAHPEFPGTIAAGAQDTRVINEVNADDYETNYASLAAFGVAVFEDGVAQTGVSVETGTATLTTEQAVIVDASAPFTITLEDAATAGDGFRLHVLVRTSAGVAATGTLTFTGNALNTEIVTIGSKTYTFQTSLTDSDGNVLIGASASDSLDNLIAAINLGAGAGTNYATSTTLNADVTAAAGAGDTMDVTAKVAGTAANSVATTTDVTGASWGAATLTGGDAAGDITLAAAGADTVLGGSTTVLADVGDSVQLVVNGTDWEAQEL